MIYFIQSGGSGHVKIGWTKNERTLRSRRSTLQTGHPSPLTIIRTIDAPRWAETWLHGFFSGVQASGEWFEYQDSMMSLEIPEGDPRPNSTGSHMVTVRIPLDLLNWLKKRAVADDRSVSSLIVHCARKEKDRCEAEKGPQKLFGLFTPDEMAEER